MVFRKHAFFFISLVQVFHRHFSRRPDRFSIVFSWAIWWIHNILVLEIWWIHNILVLEKLLQGPIIFKECKNGRSILDNIQITKFQDFSKFLQLFLIQENFRKLKVESQWRSTHTFTLFLASNKSVSCSLFEASFLKPTNLEMLYKSIFIIVCLKCGQKVLPLKLIERRSLFWCDRDATQLWIVSRT